METESNGVPDSRDDKAMYPRIQYDPKKWKEVVNSFYIILFAVAAILGIVNYATYSGSMWSVIAIGCIVYVAVSYTHLRGMGEAV